MTKTTLDYEEMLAAKQRALDDVLQEVAKFKFDVGAVSLSLSEIAERHNRFATNMNTLQREVADRSVLVGELTARITGLCNAQDRLNEKIIEQRRENAVDRQALSNAGDFNLKLLEIVKQVRSLFKTPRFAEHREVVLPIQRMINSAIGAEQHEVV